MKSLVLLYLSLVMLPLTLSIIPSFSLVFKTGISGFSLNWFSSYLSSRQWFRSQAVSIDDFISAFSNLSCGVPQASVLGPLLFTWTIMVSLKISLRPQEIQSSFVILSNLILVRNPSNSSDPLIHWHLLIHSSKFLMTILNASMPNFSFLILLISLSNHSSSKFNQFPSNQFHWNPKSHFFSSQNNKFLFGNQLQDTLRVLSLDFDIASFGIRFLTWPLSECWTFMAACSKNTLNIYRHLPIMMALALSVNELFIVWHNLHSLVQHRLTLIEPA